MRSIAGIVGLILSIAALAVGNHYSRPDLAFWSFLGVIGVTFVAMAVLKD